MFLSKQENNVLSNKRIKNFFRNLNIFKNFAEICIYVLIEYFYYINKITISISVFVKKNKCTSFVWKREFFTNFFFICC